MALAPRAPVGRPWDVHERPERDNGSSLPGRSSCACEAPARGDEPFIIYYGIVSSSSIIIVLGVFTYHAFFMEWMDERWAHTYMSSEQRANDSRTASLRLFGCLRACVAHG